jgi:trimethylamine:corrinoid methyltransferase-like protein
MKPSYFETLSPEEVELIDRESSRILEECGVRVLHKECLDLLEDAGCKVDRATSMVKMPRDVVLKALETTPSSFLLYGRDTSFKLDLGGGEVYFGPGGFAVFAEDLDTGVRRRALREDFIAHLRLSDALPTCEFNHVNVNPSDIPPENADLFMWADALIYQTKPIMNENYDLRSVDALVEMGTVIRGTREAFLEMPMVCLDVCIMSPLTHVERQVDLLLAGARYGLPISINSGPIGGGTAPVTLAAVALQANVELLSAVVITYAAKPGTPILYGSWGRHMDMRNGLVTMGGPEFGMLKLTTAQMGRYYHLPTRGGGALSDSLISDAQAGYEKMLTTLVPAIGGVHYISGMGLNEAENCFSAAQLVIDDEVVAMIKRVLMGIEVDDAHLAADLIMSVGPGGQFLDAEHTYQYFRKELFDPKISNRTAHENWVKAGSTSVRERAAEKARNILARTPEHTLEEYKVKELYAIAGVENIKTPA